MDSKMIEAVREAIETELDVCIDDDPERLIKHLRTLGYKIVPKESKAMLSEVESE